MTLGLAWLPVGVALSALAANATQAQPLITLGGGCSPSTTWPDEATLLHCRFDITKSGDAVVQNARLRVGPNGAPTSIPSYVQLSTAMSDFAFPRAEIGRIAPGKHTTAETEILVEAEASFSDLSSLNETTLARLAGDLP